MAGPPSSRRMHRLKAAMHAAFTAVFMLCWVAGGVALYLGYRFHQSAPSVPGNGAVFELNNHGNVRYLTATQYYGSFGLLFSSVVVAIVCGVAMALLEGKKKE